MRIISRARVPSSHHFQAKHAAIFLRGGIFALLVSLFLTYSPRIWAQTTPDAEEGMKPYGSFHGGDIDQVSLSSGKLVLHIPLASYAQRGGKMQVSFEVQWRNLTPQDEDLCIPSCTYIGSRSTGPAGLTFVDGLGYTASPSQAPPPYTGTSAVVTSPDGVFQVMAYSGSTFEALDATGLRFDPNSETLYTRNGVRYAYNLSSGYYGPVKVEDTSGNEITWNGSGWTDTLGRTIGSPLYASSTSNYDGCTGTQPVTAATTWTIPGPNSTSDTFKFCYANFSYNLPLPHHGTSVGFSGVVQLLQSIVFPNSTTWTFNYDPVYAALSQITLPTGGTINYTWQLLSAPCQNSFTDKNGVETTKTGYYLAVASRTVNSNDGTGAHQWNYSGWSTTGGTVKITDPLGNDSLHVMTGLGSTGSLYETQTQSYQGLSSGGALLKTVSTDYSFQPTPFLGPSPSCSTVTSVVPIRITTLWPNGQTKKQEMDYDSGFKYSAYSTSGLTGTGIYGVVLAKREFDFGPNSPGPLLRTTTTNYLAFTNSAYLSNNLLSLPSSIQVTNGAGTQTALSTYGYDESQLTPSGIATQHDLTPPAGSARGNLTSIHEWLNTTGGYLTSTATYFDTGEIDVATDPKGNATTYAYSPTYVGALPTTVTNALNQTSTNAYDFNTGLLTSTTDPNGQTTSFSYDPLTLRKIQTNYPDGGQLSYCYSDTPSEGCASGPPYQVIITKKITSSQNQVETATVDGLGRLSQTELNSDPSGPDYTVITYDAGGRKASETNPYRSTSDSTYGLTSYQYDALNRPTLVTKPDGSTVSTVYNGNSTTVTDEAGKTRESFTDGLGRLTEVIENPGGLGYITNYTYDALDDLVGVAQGGSRQRSFVYDSLKRLTSSTNPEAGNVGYSYDADGNVVTKTDARAITITYAWDPLNRMTGRSYSNGDPSVSYAYDQTTCVIVPNCYNIGRMTSITDAAGSESFAYDKMGRMSADQRTTNSITKNASYAYYLDGSLQTLNYPSGNSVTYTVGAAGLPLSAGDSTFLYAGEAIYTPWGALTQDSAVWQPGVGFHVANTTRYNVRMQPCWKYVSNTVITVSGCTTSYVAGEFMDARYNFNLAADNGNLVGITNDINGNRSQAYSYDQLNRITNAGTLSTCTANCWGLTFGVDQWSNLTSATGTGSASTASFSVQVSAGNQITSLPFSYDPAGNLLKDVTSTYAWNAESEMKTGGGVGYLYDGQGNRVEKSGEKLYWYGPGGEVLDETDSTGSTTNAAFAEYVYFDGERVARRDSQNNVLYYFEDQVNSSRAIVELASGSGTPTLCYDADFYPYGGEDVFTNTCPQNYKFQGKERDPETGNDYFGARFYSSTYGRFLSPDWSSVPAPVPYANLTNPQTLNLYAMVGDNPESFADLNGHMIGEKIGDINLGLIAVAEREEERYCEIHMCPTKAAPQSTVASAELDTAIEDIKEIDAVVKPLIESAGEEAGASLARFLGPLALVAAALLDAPATARDEDMLNKAKGLPPDAVKLKKGQGYRDKSGNTWRKDKLHKDHWDIIDRKGRKVREVTFDGRQIWPGGPKNNQ